MEKLQGITVSTDFYGKNISINTGRYAKLASGSAWVTMGETVLLVTACRSAKPREGASFLPLTVDVQEKFYSVGKLPGGFFKREGRPSEFSQLLARLTDRPIRPLFPKGFAYDTQIIINVFSFDGECQPDVLGILGASAALSLSDLPFAGPISAVRIARIDGEIQINPNISALKGDENKIDIDLLVASGPKGIVMVEGAGEEALESDVSDALFQAHEANLKLIELQRELVSKVGARTKIQMVPPVEIEWPDSFMPALKNKIQTVLAHPEKLSRQDTTRVQKNELVEWVQQDDVFASLRETFGMDKLVAEAKSAFEKQLGEGMCSMILNDGKRVDGRGLTDVRPIWGDTRLLPRVHGSGLFTRGETQVLSTITLGSGDDEQTMDTIHGRYTKSFLLHYNFPPFSVGESGFMRGPGRREIGHGALAERALKPVVPKHDDFNYTIRLVSEVLESNGSSSMGTICSGTMAMLDAGVPLRKSVAGIAMGLIQADGKTAVLSDILGDEDHLGQMDFKVAGTEAGITAIQMDIKVDGLTQEVMVQALNQARAGRLHILKEMAKVIHEPSQNISKYAPRIWLHQIKPARIKDLIGTGGKNIKGIIEETGVKIDVEDTGKVTIASTEETSALKAIELIKGLTTDPEVGQEFDGKVRKVMAYGCFVDLLPGVSGLVHISELADRRIDSVEEVCTEGDSLRVKIVEVDRTGRIRLSHKATFQSEDTESQSTTP